MLAIAFVDGRAVPATMSLAQIHAVLPQGVAGLRSTADNEPVFPNESGTIHLVPQKHYTMTPVSEFQATVASPRANHGSESAKKMTREHAADISGDSPAPARSRGGLPVQTLQPYTPLESTFASGFASALPESQDEDSNRPVTALARPAATTTPTPSNASSDQRLRSSSLTRSFEPRGGKLILDRVHEHLMLPMLVFDIIDTPEFQRLRGLKQLGTCSYLYPGATHTRFEHSIGVAHLAGLMAKKIARRQPELGISDEDILCVTVAGLCHDLGHGPFSHLFETIVNRFRNPRDPWHHESMSTRLLLRVLERLNVGRYNLREEDARFIALCVHGLRRGAPWPNNVGRPVEKRFLLEIVSNKRSGIDVDKLDYFMRDSLCCYGRTAVDCHIPRLLSACRVLCFEGEYQICYEEKLALSLGDIFTLRAKLHKYAYQHRIVKVIDHMVSDILAAADPYFFVKGKDQQPKRISECVDDVEAFIRLGDWIIDAMAASTDPHMRRAQHLIQRLYERDLYDVAGMAMFARHQHRTSPDVIKDELLSFIPDETVSRQLEESLIVDFVKITYGSSDSEGNPDDPINNVTFYNPKSVSPQAFRLPRARQSPLFSPSEFGEKSVMIIVRDHDLAKTATVAFQKWKEAHTRNLGVEVPVYNLSPGGGGGAGNHKAKRLRDEDMLVKFVSPANQPVQLNLTSLSEGIIPPDPVTSD